MLLFEYIIVSVLDRQFTSFKLNNNEQSTSSAQGVQENRTGHAVEGGRGLFNLSPVNHSDTSLSPALVSMHAEGELQRRVTEPLHTA